ncbi:MAG: methyltransferase [Nitrospinota bacterium]
MASSIASKLNRVIGKAVSAAAGGFILLTGPGNARFIVRRLQKKFLARPFTVAGVKYHVDPCSVGHTPQGELTGAAAAERIRREDLAGLHVLDICCGVGIVGLTLCAKLKGEGRVRKLSLLDINIFNLNSARRTLRRNDFGGIEFQTFLSDSLKAVPGEERFDLIVSNPPHIHIEDITQKTLNPTTLGTYDEGWQFHRDFYAVADRHLSEGGQIWLLENFLGDPAMEAHFRSFVDANPRLRYVESRPEPNDPGGNMWWVVSRRAG